LAKSVDSENSALYNHIQEKFFDKEDVLQHLYQTNMMIDKLIYLGVWALHMGHYEHEDFEELKGVKKNLTRVDSDFRKHQPKLELLDKEVKERVAREKRGKHIYG
jgi:hypothetical protein